MFFSVNTRVSHHRVEIAPYRVAGRLGTITLGMGIALSIILALAFFNQGNLILMNGFIMCVICTHQLSLPHIYSCFLLIQKPLG